MIISLHLGRSLWRCVTLPVAMGLHGLDGRILGLAVCALEDLSTSSLVKPPISIQTKTQTTLLTFVLLLSMDFHKMLSKFLITVHIKLITREQTVFSFKRNMYSLGITQNCRQKYIYRSSWSMNGKGGYISLIGISSLYSQT